MTNDRLLSEAGEGPHRQVEHGGILANYRDSKKRRHIIDGFSSKRLAELVAIRKHGPEVPVVITTCPQIAKRISDPFCSGVVARITSVKLCESSPSSAMRSAMK